MGCATHIRSVGKKYCSDHGFRGCDCVLCTFAMMMACSSYEGESLVLLRQSKNTSSSMPSSLCCQKMFDVYYNHFSKMANSKCIFRKGVL